VNGTLGIVEMTNRGPQAMDNGTGVIENIFGKAGTKGPADEVEAEPIGLLEPDVPAFSKPQAKPKPGDDKKARGPPGK
jgi:hypothetical protein